MPAGQDEPVADRDDVGELACRGRRARRRPPARRRGGNGSSSSGQRRREPTASPPSATGTAVRERLGHAPGEPVAHRHRVLPGRAGHPLAGALVAGAALQEDARALVPAPLDRGPAVAHEIGRDVGRDAQPGRGRVAAVRQDRADRAAVRSIEPDDRHLRDRSGPPAGPGAPAAGDRSGGPSGRRAASAGDCRRRVRPCPCPIADPCRGGPVGGLRDGVDDRGLERAA